MPTTAAEAVASWRRGDCEVSTERARLDIARVVTDRATFAYLCDVWIDAAGRGAIAS